MGTRFPVAVRINDGRTERHVTAAVSNLRWKITASGGFHSASMTLNLDPETFADLGPADQICIYGPTGIVLWEGFIDNPGRSAGRTGVGFDLAAMGTIVLASDESRPLSYIDRMLDGWEPYGKNVASANATTSDDPTDVLTTNGLLTGFNSGSPVGAGSVAQIGYTALRRAGMEFGRFSANYKSGKADSGYAIELAYSGPGITSGTSSLQPNFSTSLRSSFRSAGAVGQPPAGTNAIALRVRRTGAATNVTDDDTWTWFESVAVVARRMDRTGTLLAGADLQAYGHVRADWVVEDLVGRLLTLCDLDSVDIDPATFQIDQLAYPDGATVADVLDDLELYEPDFHWGLGRSRAKGFEFWYRKWPTTVRYEVSTQDGYNAPGADFDLCNRIAVSWTDPGGKEQSVTVTAASAPGAFAPGGVTATVFAPALSALEEAGRTRDAEAITLPEGRGSATNAQRIGEQVLTAKANPPKAATVTVRRPIVDLLRGGTVMPYEIEPGYLALVREVGDRLRITEVDVDDEAGEATLTLGEPMLTTEQRIARLERTAQRRQ